VRGLRHVPKAVEELAREKAMGASSLQDLVQKMRSADGLADGPCGGGGQGDRRPPAPPRGGDILIAAAIPGTGTHPPREGTRAREDPLRGRRDERGRVGPGTWILHDDRGEKEVVQRLAPVFATLAPGAGDIPRTPVATGSAEPRSRDTCIAGPTGPATSSRWSTTASSTASWPPTRKDWAYCARPTSARGNTGSTRRRRRCATPGTTGTTSTCATSRNSGGGAA